MAALFFYHNNNLVSTVFAGFFYVHVYKSVATYEVSYFVLIQKVAIGVNAAFEITRISMNASHVQDF